MDIVIWSAASELESLGKMANSKQVLVCMILLVILFVKFESRSLEAFMVKKKTPTKGFAQELIQKSQLMKTTFAKIETFSNPTVSKRLSPGGPDPKHH
ncbi:unnamed protein product [Sphenostylis stenocarpa]|uniref:Uncharacterized protein n=1 Tax=Sphenostylis stenocarpa TaxID=92480 RepID=A0AA86SSC5_9FABA|nr:unnamed protein product [Sphenostylis stenocarpa]